MSTEEFPPPVNCAHTFHCSAPRSDFEELSELENEWTGTGYTVFYTNKQRTSRCTKLTLNSIQFGLFIQYHIPTKVILRHNERLILSLSASTSWGMWNKEREKNNKQQSQSSRQNTKQDGRTSNGTLEANCSKARYLQKGSESGRRGPKTYRQLQQTTLFKAVTSRKHQQPMSTTLHAKTLTLFTHLFFHNLMLLTQ